MAYCRYDRSMSHNLNLILRMANCGIRHHNSYASLKTLITKLTLLKNGSYQIDFMNLIQLITFVYVTVSM